MGIYFPFVGAREAENRPILLVRFSLGSTRAAGFCSFAGERDLPPRALKSSQVVRFIQYKYSQSLHCGALLPPGLSP
jgi:hypothetical protein